MNIFIDVESGKWNNQSKQKFRAKKRNGTHRESQVGKRECETKVDSKNKTNNEIKQNKFCSKFNYAA